VPHVQGRPTASGAANHVSSQPGSSMSDLFLLERQRRLDAGAGGHAVVVPSPAAAVPGSAAGPTMLEPTRTASVESTRSLSREMRTSSGVRFADETPQAALSRRLSDAYGSSQVAVGGLSASRATSDAASQTVDDEQQQQQQQQQQLPHLSSQVSSSARSAGSGLITVVGEQHHQQQNQTALQHSGSSGSDLRAEGHGSGTKAPHDGTVEPVRRPSRRIIVKHLGGSRGLDHGGGSGGSRAASTALEHGGSSGGSHDTREAEGRGGPRSDGRPELTPSSSGAVRCIAVFSKHSVARDTSPCAACCIHSLH